MILKLIVETNDRIFSLELKFLEGVVDVIPEVFKQDVLIVERIGNNCLYLLFY